MAYAGYDHGDVYCSTLAFLSVLCTHICPRQEYRTRAFFVSAPCSPCSSGFPISLFLPFSFLPISPHNLRLDISFPVFRLPGFGFAHAYGRLDGSIRNTDTFPMSRFPQKTSPAVVPDVRVFPFPRFPLSLFYFPLVSKRITPTPRSLVGFVAWENLGGKKTPERSGILLLPPLVRNFRVRKRAGLAFSSFLFVFISLRTSDDFSQFITYSRDGQVHGRSEVPTARCRYYTMAARVTKTTRGSGNCEHKAET